MAMVNTRPRWTLAQVHSLPDNGNKYELVHGDLLVTPPPTTDHETIAARLGRILDVYVAAQSLGYVYRPRAVFRVGETLEVEPDLMVRQAPPPKTQWQDAPLPILLVEIASDSTRRRDRIQKRGVYMDAGIADYWIVDGDDRSVICVRQGEKDRVSMDSLVWHPLGATSPLVINLDDVFGAAT